MPPVNPKVTVDIHADGRTVRNELSNLDALIKRVGSSSKSAFQSVLGGNLASNAIQNITARVTEGGVAVFNYASKLEQAKVSFSSLMGSADLAATHLQDLQKLSRSTPLEFESIAKMSARLQGAGVQAGNLIPLIKDIGNVAAATGELSSERMEGIGAAFAQIASKGRVSAEEMEQLAERGIPAWRILSQSIGKSAAETRKMAEQGEITSEQLFAAFQKFSRLNYGDAMEQQAKTFSGSMQTIENVALQTANTAFQPFFTEVSKFSSKIAASLKEQEGQAKAAGVSFGFAIGEAIGDGIGRSKISDTSWWEWVLFPIGAAKLGRQLGNDIGEGIYKGYTEATDPLGKEVAGLEAAQKRLEDETRRYLREKERLNSILAGPGSPGESASDQRKREAAERATERKREEARRKAESEKRYQEQLRSRDRAGNLSVEESNLGTQQKELVKTLDELRVKFSQTDGAAGDRFNLIAQSQVAFREFAANARTTLAYIEELEQKQLAADATAGEKADLLQRQTERRQRLVELGQDEYKKNQDEIAAADDRIADREEARFDASIRAAGDLLALEKQRAEILESLPSVPLEVPTMSTDGIREYTAAIQQLIDRYDDLKTSMEAVVGTDNILSGLGNMAIDMFENMASAVGQAVENYWLYGESVGQALQKALAAEIAHISAMATVNAMYAGALGLLRLAQWDFAAAANAFASMGVWLAIAGGTGLAAKAIAGDRFKKDRQGGESGTGSANTANRFNDTPYTRQSDTAFYSGRNDSTASLAASVQQLADRIDSMPAHEVLTRGMKQKPGIIGRQAMNDLSTGRASGKKFAQSIGLRKG